MSREAYREGHGAGIDSARDAAKLIRGADTPGELAILAGMALERVRALRTRSNPLAITETYGEGFFDGFLDEANRRRK